MKRQIQAITSDRLFEAIDRTLVAPLRERLDRDGQLLRERITEAERRLDRDGQLLGERVTEAERTVTELVDSLKLRVVALEEAVAGLKATEERLDQHAHQLADEMRERTGTIGVETETTAAAVADLAERLRHLELATGARSALP